MGDAVLGEYMCPLYAMSCRTCCHALWETVTPQVALHAAVEMQPQDKEELLLSSDTIDEMLNMYSPAPPQPDSQATLPASNRNFSVKFLNIMDPLLPTNNLGRSVSKASFARIRKALKHGAETLTDIMLKVRAVLLDMCWYTHAQFYHARLLQCFVSAHDMAASISMS